jgi:hypothetical protein
MGVAENWTAVSIKCARTAEGREGMAREGMRVVGAVGSEETAMRVW